MDNDRRVPYTEFERNFSYKDVTISGFTLGEALMNIASCPFLGDIIDCDFFQVKSLLMLNAYNANVFTRRSFEGMQGGTASWGLTTLD
eukprot:scaffold235851_cov18-Prasinocladus_malaysianus.AAC.1